MEVLAASVVPSQEVLVNCDANEAEDVDEDF